MGACAGGRFSSVSSVSDDGGTTAVLTHSFDAGTFAPSVPALVVTRVPVSCEKGAGATLAFDFQPTDCRSEDFSWQQTRGPSLLHEPGGSDLSFATRTHDLEAQAGQQVAWDVTGTIAPGNSVTVSRAVLLEPVEFIEVTHKTSVPIAREEEALTIEVVIHNTTDCAVSGLLLREFLGSLKAVPDTVRVAGVRFEPVVGTGTLEISDLSLAARGTTIVTYQARAPLLAAAKPGAQVAFRGYDVTIRAGGLDRPSTGCGCDSSTPGMFALAALTALVMRARRRSR
jgi:MYXO-CTERM domain-containing protein